MVVVVVVVVVVVEVVVVVVVVEVFNHSLITFNHTNIHLVVGFECARQILGRSIMALLNENVVTSWRLC